MFLEHVLKSDLEILEILRGVETTLRYTYISRDTKQKLVGGVGFFGSFNEAVEISIFLEHAGIYELVLPLGLAPLCIFCNELFVGKLSMWVFVEVFHV